MKTVYDFKEINEDKYAASIAENLIKQAIMACPDFLTAVRVIQKAYKNLGEAVPDELNTSTS